MLIFRQSDVPEVTELTWLLGTVAPMGLLERCHSYKDKIAKGIAFNFGLFAYPVLIAQGLGGAAPRRLHFFACSGAVMNNVLLRPVATTLLMVAILLAGAVAYHQLAVSALPQVDYPTIQVLTFYPGASPDVMASSVTAPLERQFGQMPGLNQMMSTSSSGSSVITLQFTLNLSLDVAEQEVQAAINAAATYLPRDLPNPPIYSKINPADAPVLTLALTSATLPLAKVQDLADTRLAQKISQLAGVGLVSISGGQRPASPRRRSGSGRNLPCVTSGWQPSRSAS